jgi:hypothetical protein
MMGAMKPGLLAALLFLTMAFTGALAHAQEDPAVLFAEGQAHYSAGRYPEAYAAYKRAYDLKPTYDAAANLGNVEVKLGKYKDAVGHLQFVLDNLPLSLDPATREAVIAKTHERLAEAKRHVAVIDVKIAPDGASVTVNGEPIGTTPLAAPVVLDPGQHQLLAKKPGYADLAQTITARPATSEALNLTMTPGASGGGSQAGRVAVAVVGGVLALGAIGAGIGLLVASSGKGDDREALAGELGGNTSACANGNPDPRCGEIAGLADDELAFRGAGISLAVVGGVLAVATVVTVLVWPSQTGQEAALALGPGTVTLSGRF